MDANTIIGAVTAIGTLLAAIFAAKAAGASAQQTRLQGESLQEEQRHRTWLLGRLPELRESRILTLEEKEAPSAVFWIHAGVLEWVPTEYSGKLNVRMRRS